MSDTQTAVERAIGFGHEACRDHPGRAIEVFNDHLEGAAIGQPRGNGGMP